jgi:epoxyqueuosine reductase
MIAADSLPFLVEEIRAWALELGFADAGVAHLDLGADLAHLRGWLARGDHGGMDYMARDPAQRADPSLLRPGTLSVISLRMDYRVGSIDEARAHLADGDAAYIARYALGRDYHRTMRGRLLKLGKKLDAAIGDHGYRVLTDSAPALEKALARNARLGWIGKNTLLMNRQAGSLFFLGEIYTDLMLPPSEREAVTDLCGSCSACLDICPTQAFTAPHRLDARRCISYLTIEHHGAIPEDLRPLIGNRIFGCDDCQLVCPWNRYARLSSEPDFAPRHSLDSAKLIELFSWSEAQWLAKTEGMALRRAGYPRWLRNIAVALGNAPRSAATIAALNARANFDDEVVREHVAWALARQSS